ncbi:ATP-binding protein [Vibrio ulleungensis]|uniref:histidine kinase n=1 Tax=Vibrio ulleungensis TaxID=2807619 RepID=A0ABS2HFR5_9VIBR|nr:ATP-binding protein [Vibrio ulleungensis]MBM7034922.1 response regulator [Vibrio ulleungensis]
MSLRTYFVLFLSLIGLLLTVNLVAKHVYETELRQLNQLTESQKNIQLIVRQLAASSEDLTRLARAYVVTLDPAFAEDYDQILQARKGQTPLILSTVKQKYFWGESVLPTTELSSIREQLTQSATITIDLQEFDQALQLSNRLAIIEKDAIALADVNKSNALAMLYNADYYTIKERIFKHIQHLATDVDDKYSGQIQTIIDNIRFYRSISWTVNIALVVSILVLIRFLYSSIVVPLFILSDYANTYSPSQPGGRLKLRSKIHELKSLNNAINHMQERIHNDVIQAQKQIEVLEVTQRQAEAATEARGQFLANMSHEIRTPLNGIIGFCHLLQATELNDTQSNYTTMSLRSANALMTIINDILDWSKVDSGQSVIDLSTVNLGEKVDFVIGVTRLSSEEKSLNYDVIIDENVPVQLLSDAAKLRQILLNLLSNAIKFTQQGTITLHVSATLTHVHFSVTDSGIGMSEEQINRVFDPFIQADNSTTRTFGGTGLGLAISQKYAQLLDGEITIKSRLGKGSQATLTLPLKVPDASAQPEAFSDQVYSGPHIQVGLQLNDKHQYNYCLMLLKHLNIEVSNHFESCSLLIVDHHAATHSQPQSIARNLPLVFIGPLYAFEQDRKDNHWGSVTHLPWPFTKLKLLTTLQHCMTTTPDGQKQHAKNNLTLASMKLKVLVAEDVLMNQLVIERMLKNLGVESVIVGDGAQAIDALQQHAIDLIFMDLHMPVMDGYQAAQRIRQLEQFQHIPIVALSADVQQSAKERCEQIGFNGFILKPFKPIDLENALNNVVPRAKS